MGDTCNREMGETFSGTRLSEATPRCLWSQVDTCKEDQTSLCIPIRPTQELSRRTQREKLLYCYKSVAPIFTWGRETPPHSTMHYFQTFHCFSCLLQLFALYCLSIHMCDLLIGLSRISVLYAFFASFGCVVSMFLTFTPLMFTH